MSLHHSSFQANINIFKATTETLEKCEICSKLTIKTRDRRY